MFTCFRPKEKHVENTPGGSARRMGDGGGTQSQQTDTAQRTDGPAPPLPPVSAQAVSSFAIRLKTRVQDEAGPASRPTSEAGAVHQLQTAPTTTLSNTLSTNEDVLAQVLGSEVLGTTGFDRKQALLFLRWVPQLPRGRLFPLGIPASQASRPVEEGKCVQGMVRARVPCASWPGAAALGAMPHFLTMLADVPAGPKPAPPLTCSPPQQAASSCLKTCPCWPPAGGTCRWEGGGWLGTKHNQGTWHNTVRIAGARLYPPHQLPKPTCCLRPMRGSRRSWGERRSLCLTCSPSSSWPGAQVAW